MNISNSSIKALHQSLSLISIERPSPVTFYCGGTETIKQNVPINPGIYAIFYKNDGKCFYVGRAMNLKGRLTMHFGPDAKKNYRGVLGKLKQPEKFQYWYYDIPRPPKKDIQKFKCLLSSLESICSAAWLPEVESKTF